MLLELGAAAGQQRGGTIKLQCLALQELVKPVSGRGIEGAQVQVVTDALLMFGNGLRRSA